MRQLLDLLDAGVALFDAEGKALFANKFLRERFGELQRGKPYYEGLRSLELISLIHDTYGAEEGKEGTLNYRGRRYRVRTFYTTEGVGLLVEDISDREAFEEAKREFLTHLSHELRTPLSVALLGLETLKEELPQEKREPLERSLKRLKEMEELLRSVYFLTLEEKGEEKKVSLRGLVEEVLTSFKEEVRRRELKVEVKGEATALGDAGRLRIAVKNLLENAVKFNRRGGSVKVELYEEGGDAVLRVEDTGIGIKREKLPFVKAPFVKGEGSGGMGLGLSLVDRVVKLHGGKWRIESEEGKGTRVELRLPSAS